MGYGDEIMATAEARRIRQENPEAKIIIGDGVQEYWSELFEGNPNIDRLAETAPDDRIIWLRNYRGHRPYIDYSQSDMNRKMYYLPYRAEPGDLFLCNEQVKAFSNKLRKLNTAGLPLLFIEPHVDFGQPKDWGFSKWQELVSILKNKFFFIQPSYAGRCLLSGATPITTQSFLDACALLSVCDYFVGPEGGLHHASAALGKPGVVIFGGRISPAITGYELHTNMYVDLPLSPCGMIEPCDHCRTCMDRISVDEVSTALCAILR